MWRWAWGRLPQLKLPWTCRAARPLWPSTLAPISAASAFNLEHNTPAAGSDPPLRRGPGAPPVRRTGPRSLFAARPLARRVSGTGRTGLRDRRGRRRGRGRRSEWNRGRVRTRRGWGRARFLALGGGARGCGRAGVWLHRPVRPRSLGRVPRLAQCGRRDPGWAEQAVRRGAREHPLLARLVTRS